MGACSFSSFATAFPFLNVRLHLWRWRHPVRVFERFPTIVRRETNSGVTQWLHFRSLWEDMGKLPILSKKVRFSKLPYKAFKMLELIKKQHKQKLIDSVWDYLAEMLDRIGWESLSWAFARELAHPRVFWMITSNFTSSYARGKTCLKASIYAQKHGNITSKFIQSLIVSEKTSPCNPLTMRSWPSCLGSKHFKTLSLQHWTWNPQKHIEMAKWQLLPGLMFVRWTFRCWTQDSVVKWISGISRLNTNQRHSKPLR